MTRRQAALRHTYKDIAISTEVPNVHPALHVIYDAGWPVGQVVEGAKMAALSVGEAPLATHVALTPLQHGGSVHHKRRSRAPAILYLVLQ